MTSIKKFNEFLIKESTEQAETLIKRKLDQIQIKLEGLFKSDEVGDSGEVKKFGQSQDQEQIDIFKDLTLQSIEQSKFAKTYKTIKLIFSDDEYRYDTTFKIDLKDAVPKEGQEEVDPEALSDCKVEFKRYSLEEGSEMKGEISKTVSIDKIDASFFEELLVDLEKESPSETPSEQEFKIETEEEGEESQEENA